MLLTVVEVFGFGWRDAVGVVVVEPAAVEPVDPFQGGELEVVESSPRAAVADELGLVEPDDRLGQGVVVALSGQSWSGVKRGFVGPVGQLALRRGWRVGAHNSVVGADQGFRAPFRGPGIGTRFGTRGLSIGLHRGRSTTTAEFSAPTGSCAGLDRRSGRTPAEAAPTPGT